MFLRKPLNNGDFEMGWLFERGIEDLPLGQQVLLMVAQSASWLVGISVGESNPPLGFHLDLEGRYESPVSPPVAALASLLLAWACEKLTVYCRQPANMNRTGRKTKKKNMPSTVKLEGGIRLRR